MAGRQLLYRFQVSQSIRFCLVVHSIHRKPRDLTNNINAEVELISLMDRNGIGTDATIAQHITTIQERAYAMKDNNQKFVPTKLGIALVEGECCNKTFDIIVVKISHNCVTLFDVLCRIQ